MNRFSLLLRKLFSRRKSNAPDCACVFFLVAPSYDRFTKYTAAWVKDIRIPAGFTGVRLAGPGVCRTDLLKLLRDHENRFSMTIFCGHGISEALLGSPTATESSDVEGTPIYDQDLIELGPTHMFAFCCAAGRSLGRKLTQIPRRAFIGYEGDLPIYIGDAVATRLWQRVIERFTLHVMGTNGISPESKGALLRIYDEEFDAFVAARGRSRNGRLLMRSYVKRHKRLLCFYAA